MGNVIDVLSLASFASLAIATNASYLNLPYFRYRMAISDQASQSFKQYKNIKDENLINLKEYKLLQELSRIDGSDYPANQGAAHVEWECEEGRIYLKTFHKHQDKRISTAALWMSGSYLGLSTFSNVSTDLVISSAVSLYILLVSVVIFGMTYACCDYSQQARFISVVRKKNKKMLCPAFILTFGLLGILCGDPVMLYLIPALAATAGQYQDVYVFIAGKLSLLLAIAAMIFGIFYPMNLIRQGNQVVDKAKHTIDECDASLTPFLGIAKEKIEEELGDIEPVRKRTKAKIKTSDEVQNAVETDGMAEPEPDNDDENQSKKDTGD